MCTCISTKGQKKLPDDFAQKSDNACASVETIMGYGVEAMTNLIISVISCVITFATTNQLPMLFVISIVLSIFITFVVRPHQNKLRVYRKDVDDKVNKLDTLQSIFTVMFIKGEYQPSKLIDHCVNICCLRSSVIFKYIVLENIVEFQHLIGCLLALYFANSPIQFLLLNRIFSKLDNSVSFFAHFINQYGRAVVKWNSYCSMFEGIKEFCSIPTQFPFDGKTIDIQPATIGSSDHMTIRVPKLISLSAGKCYYISGASGNGKTTFLDLLIGDHPNLWINNRPAIVHRKYIRKYSQAVASLIPTNLSLGISVLFKHITDDQNVIQFALHLAHLFEYENPNKWEPNEKINLSGGEKQRLALAIFLASFIVERVNDQTPRLLMLDEMNQGIDLPTFVSIIKAIRQYFSDDIIMFTIHAELEDPSIFDGVIKVSNGEVYG